MGEPSLATLGAGFRRADGAVRRSRAPGRWANYLHLSEDAPGLVPGHDGAMDAPRTWPRSPRGAALTSGGPVRTAVGEQLPSTRPPQAFQVCPRSPTDPASDHA